MGKTSIGRSASNTRAAGAHWWSLQRQRAAPLMMACLCLFASGFAASPDDPARSEHTAQTSDQTIIAMQGTAPSPVAVPESRKAAVLRNEEDSDSTAEMMVKIAKGYQNKAFDDITVRLNAALDHAKNLVETRVGGEAASKDNGCSSLESNFEDSQGSRDGVPRRGGRVDESNVIKTLEYTWEVAGRQR
jgi:hypothetical protein